MTAKAKDTAPDNLALWQQVDKTDTTATKTANQGGRQQTSIDGYWMIRRATALFGPLGIGWGYEILEERWDQGAPIVVQVGETLNTVTGLTHTTKLRLWYTLNGQTGELVQYGHTPALYRSKHGASDDGEAPKKSLMDAIKKSLSMLGFCADVFMGQFDDREYREQLETEQALAKAENRDAEIEAKKTELTDYVTRHLELIKTAKSAHEVKATARTALRHLEYQKRVPVLTAIAEKGLKAIARDAEAKQKEFAERRPAKSTKATPSSTANQEADQP